MTYPIANLGDYGKFGPMMKATGGTLESFANKIVQDAAPALINKGRMQGGVVALCLVTAVAGGALVVKKVSEQAEKKAATKTVAGAKANIKVQTGSKTKKSAESSESQEAEKGVTATQFKPDEQKDKDITNDVTGSEASSTGNRPDEASIPKDDQHK